MRAVSLQERTLHSYIPAVESRDSFVMREPETRWYNASSGRAHPAV
jgi:hypothetical protein